MTDKLHFDDLSKITCPPGMLDKDTQERLKASGGPYQYFDGLVWSAKFPCPPLIGCIVTRLKPKPKRDALKAEVERLKTANKHLHRSFPEAGDGRAMPPMGDDLMTAGLNSEDARFVAIQLERNGLTLVGTDQAYDKGWNDAIEAAAAAVLDEYLDDDTETDADKAYDTGVHHSWAAVVALKKEESK